MDRVVRVRFAPRPTGLLHLDGLHTALFNWLFARHQGGKFILRLADAGHPCRESKAERGVYLSLKWLGLDWDEGPVSYQKFSERGPGERGPYRQSERGEIYTRYLEQLRERARVYPCFCAREELERRRRESARKGIPYLYSGRCATLSEAEQEERLKAQPDPRWRFRAEPRDFTWRDLVRGELRAAGSQLGDFLLLRRSGFPSSNFAAVVDDHLMEITHVIRGEERLPYTPRQLLLYEALGWEPPRFAHLPLLTGEDKRPLAKQACADSLDDLFAAGFLPAAIINHLALLGWSPASGGEILSREDLIREFSLERVNRSPAAFDRRKLTWLNGKHLRSMEADDLLAALGPYLAHAGHCLDDYPRDRLLNALDLVKERLELLSEAVRELEVFLDERPALEPEAEAWLKNPGAAGLLEEFERSLERAGGFSEAEVNRLIKKAGAAAGVRGRALYLPLRVAVSGRLQGPELIPMIALLGPERTRERIRAALELARTD